MTIANYCETVGCWRFSNRLNASLVRATSFGMACLLGLFLLFALPMESTAQAIAAGPDNLPPLQKRVTVSWNSADLAGVLNNIATNQGQTIFLDRRLDPGQPIQMQLRDVPVGEVIYRVAEYVDGGACWLGDVVYVGPRHQVARLVLLRDELLAEIRKMPSGKRRALLKQSRWEYPRLSNPAELWKAELNELGVTENVVQENLLHHDLWVSGNFPAIRKVDRLILLTYGFGMMPEFQSGDFKSLRETLNTSDESSDEKSIQIRVTGKRRTAIQDDLERQGVSGIRCNKNTLIATGTADRLYQVRRIVSAHEFGVHDSDGSRKGNSGKKVVSGRIKGSIHSALATAAAGLALELEFDASLRPTLQQQVDLNATRVTHEELAKMVLEETDLDYTIKEGKLLIHKK